MEINNMCVCEIEREEILKEVKNMLMMIKAKKFKK
jgi:hypothetical protein